MRVLIVESEIYLAQSIGTKLSDIGYSYETVSSVKDGIKNEKFDVVLLSTTLHGQDFYPIIEHYKDSIIILLNSYINNDTVAIPLSKGANDYILKPFMMEELIRKIRHFQEYDKVQKENLRNKEYLEFVLDDIEITEAYLNKALPIAIKSNKQEFCNKFVYKYSQMNNLVVAIIDLSIKNIKSELNNLDDNKLTYIINFHKLKNSDKSDILEKLSKHTNYIILSLEKSDEFKDIDTIEIYSENASYGDGSILSIDDYVKHIILSYQDSFPDTELSKKLGISRKSLWEKRKKYGINKKK
jgi:response regulator RpfG family c-di-GMP phosphodiesterase